MHKLLGLLLDATLNRFGYVPRDRVVHGEIRYSAGEAPFIDLYLPGGDGWRHRVSGYLFPTETGPMQPIRMSDNPTLGDLHDAAWAGDID